MTDEGRKLEEMSDTEFRNYIRNFSGGVFSRQLSSLDPPNDAFNPERGSIISLILNSNKKGVDVQERLADMRVHARHAS